MREIRDFLRKNGAAAEVKRNRTVCRGKGRRYFPLLTDNIVSYSCAFGKPVQKKLFFYKAVL